MSRKFDCVFTPISSSSGMARVRQIILETMEDIRGGKRTPEQGIAIAALARQFQKTCEGETTMLERSLGRHAALEVFSDEDVDA